MGMGISPVEDEIRVMVGAGIGGGVRVRVEIVEGLELGAAKEAKL